MPSERRRENGASRQGRRGFLARLARDSRGNTLAIVGAALIPLTAMIGSGVDMSRAYMAKTRLQSACDAASLAGRRVMQNDTMSPAVEAEARRFFDFNFPEGLYQTAEFDPVVTRPVSGTIRVTASTTIPTAVMHLFGFQTLPLSVTCEASLNFVNTDVMMVLDVTGSMAWNAAGNTTWNDADRRITALRAAVMALYEELEPIQTQLQANGMRLRYGIVPYSSTVNVGALLNSNHIANSATYQSRTPIYRQGSASTQTHSNVTSTWCNNQATLPTTNISFPISNARTSSFSGPAWSGTCTVTTATYTRNATSNFAFWYHEPRTWTTSQFKTFSSSVPLPTRTPGTNVNATAWNGCIVERDTVPTINAGSGLTIPAGATDLNINLIPNSEATRWRPMWPQVVHARLNASNGRTDQPSRNASSVSAACPAAAEPLRAWTQSALQNYVDNLQPDGGTYHDIGLLWGARLISSSGVFAHSPDTYNGMPVRRHIIFMTDGELAPTTLQHSAYGIEYMDQRTTGSSSTNNSGVEASHRQRFRMICNALRSTDVSVWVIVFGADLELDADMVNCASNENQASHSTNNADLIARFRQIGNQIGALRLTQ